MISLATLGQIDGYCDAKLGRQPSAAPRFCEHHAIEGEDFRIYAEAYYRAFRAVREQQ